MKNRIVFSLVALLAWAGGDLWAAPASKVLVTVSLSKSRFTVKRASRLGTRELSGPIVPIATNSVHPGVYHPTQIYQRYWTHNGNVVLSNVIQFGHNGNIRTSQMFSQWVSSRRPATGSIVLDPDLGSILYQTIRKYGAKNTVIQIVR